MPALRGQTAGMDPGARLAELVGARSLATDLANGFALEKTLRTTVLAPR